MLGITGIYPYIPRYRVKVETIDQAWGRLPKKGERSVGNFDEDAITMAVNTVSSVSQEWRDLDSLYFATTSGPLSEGSGAALLAYVLGAPDHCQTVDLSQALRAGTTALGMALQSGNAGSACGKKLIIAADRRKGKAGSDLEVSLGDGACAIEIGDEKPMALLLAHISQHDFSYDTWQRSEDARLQQGDVKFNAEQIVQNLVETGRKLLNQANQSADQLQWSIISTDQVRLQASVAQKLGIPADSLLKSRLHQEMGYTGVSAPFFYLYETLLKAEKGDKILLLHFGSGTDGFLFEVTEEISQFQERQKWDQPFSDKLYVGHYQEWLIRKEETKRENLIPYSTPVYVKREEENNLRLRGQKCRGCGQMVFPSRANCLHCRGKDLEWVWLNREGTIYTFTHDYLFPSEMAPMTMAVIDLDGGGRIFTQMTDYEASKVKIGDRVLMTFRKFHEGGGFSNYYWKAAPISKQGGGEE